MGRHLILILTAAALAGLSLVLASTADSKSPLARFRVCSARLPEPADRLIDEFSNSPTLTGALLSMNSSAARECSTVHDLALSVQQGVVRRYVWPVGSTLTIAFLSGDPVVQQRIENAAMAWTRNANIKFSFVKDRGAATIRIGIDLNGRSESRIGLEALRVPKGKETMHFGWLTTSSSQAEYDSVVLHEFGHVLGSVHEHHLPSADIAWNRNYVYKYCRDNWNWTEDDVNHNIFEKYEPQQLIFSRMDPLSIMMYSFPREWTNNGVGMPWNYKLSTEDITFIASCYPFSNGTRPYAHH